MKSITIADHAIAITHPHKIVFPRDGITKQEFITYYERIAPHMLPFMYNHPLTMHRFVQDIDHEGFYQKDAADYFPTWIKRVPVKKKEGGMVRYVVCNNAATLVYLANQLCITPHLWLSKIPKIQSPDRMIFDLDPAGTASVVLVRRVAHSIKMVLDELALPSFIMTTGSRGFHIIVPLKQVHTFDVVRECARTIAAQLVYRYPEMATLQVRKEKRGDRIFIDYLRNSFGATGVAPFAVRARDGAPVATPIRWDELIHKNIHPQQFTIKNIFRRLSRIKNPWEEMGTSAVTLTSALKKLQKLS
jgi:bifunctional non-homologous end joining protein LigD